MGKIAMGDSRGNVVVEFALILPILLVLIGGVIEFGLTFFVSHITQNAAREGVRLAVVLPNLQANDPRVLAEVDSNIPDSGLFSAFTGGITNTAPTGVDCALEVTVSVSGTYNKFFLLHLIGLDNIPVARTATMRYERCAWE